MHEAEANPLAEVDDDRVSMSAAPESGWRFHLDWIAVLAALSGWSYVETWARNSEFLERFFALHFLGWTLLYLVLSIVLVLIAVPVLPTPSKWTRSYALSAFAVVIAQSWGSLRAPFEGLSDIIGGFGAAAAAMLLVGFALYAVVRVSGAFENIRPAVWVLVAFLVGAHYITLFQFAVVGSPDSDQPADLAPATIASRPDVMIVILDAYGRSDVLSDRFSFDNTTFEGALSSLGVSVVPFSKANYTSTLLSVGALLEGEYPAIDDVDAEGMERMQAIHGGKNALFGALDASGYETHVFENAWSLSNCRRDVVDVCHQAGMNEIDGRVAVRSLISSIYTPWQIDPWVRRSVDQLTEAADLMSSKPETPRLVLVHALVPHAPFQLDSDCSTRWDPRFDDYVIDESVDTEAVRRAYTDQLTCVNSLLLDLLSSAPDDAVLFVTGDHGPRFAGADASRQADAVAVDLLTGVATFTAYRFPPECNAVPDDASLMVSSARLFECLGIASESDGPLRAAQPDRFFSAYKAEGKPGLTVVETTKQIAPLR